MSSIEEKTMDPFYQECKQCKMDVRKCVCISSPRSTIEIISQDGPVHKFYEVVRTKHFHSKVLEATQARDLKESFFFGFYTAMEFLGRRLPNLEDNVAKQLLQDVQADVNSVIIPAKRREQSGVIKPGSN